MAGILVVDASVAIKWFVDEEDSDDARSLLAAGHRFYAPRLMAVELGNALREKTRRGELAPAEAEVAASAIPALTINWASDQFLVSDAVRLGLLFGHPVYDCVYLALAQRLGGTVITSDKRFLKAVSNTEYQDAVIALDAFATA